MKNLSLSLLHAPFPPFLLFHAQELGIPFFHTPRGAALSSKVKNEKKKKKTADQEVDPVVQIKILIKVLKVKILLEKKSLL